MSVEDSMTMVLPRLNQEIIEQDSNNKSSKS